jgi:hypothetical protein
LSRWTQKFEIKPGTWIFVPTQETRELGEAIKSKIEGLWRPPSYYAHFAVGGHVAALKEHLQNKLFIRADIRHFFNQITRNRISRNLRLLFNSHLLAHEVACESTVRNPSINGGAYVLPFGFVQSPIIASFCLYKSALGKYLYHIRGQGFTVSVYMDDIIISTNHSIEKAQETLLQLKKKALRSRLEINPEKTFGPESRIEVFNINLENCGLEVTDNRLQDFIEKLALARSDYEIGGVLGYVKTVNEAQYHSLAHILEISQETVTPPPNPQNPSGSF